VAFIHRNQGSARSMVRGPKRQSLWLQFQPSIVTLTATGGTLIASLNAAALALRPFTIVRTRFEVFVRSDQVAAVEDQFGGFGVAVVSEQASAAGIASIPTPITDLQSDYWLQHKLMLAAGSSVNDGRVGFGWSLDSKAMRKVNNNEDIVIVSEFAAAGDGFFLISGGRMLIKTN